MIQIPSPVLARFEACLTANNVSAALWVHYKKWLRFYLDFCTKYHRDPMDSSSFAGFQQKLLDKGQTEMQRKQAAHAVGLHLGNDHASWVQVLQTRLLHNPLPLQPLESHLKCRKSMHFV
jgi:hypothetical protein